MDNIFKKFYQILLKDKKHLMQLIDDISGRKRAEEAIEKSEEKYRALVENAGDAIFVVNRKGQYLEVNKKACEMFGYTKEEFLSLEIRNIIAPDQMDTVLGYFGELLEKGQNSCEFDVIRKNGERLSVELNAVSLGNDRYIGIKRDITDRKSAEESLLLERNRLFNVFEAIEDGIYIVDQNYDIEYVNPILKNEFGPYEGRKCYEYFHDREEVCPWCKNDEVFAGKTVSGEWYSFKNNKTYNFMDTPLKNPDGSISKLEIFRDITEQKKAEETLIKSEEKYRRIVEINPDIIYQLDTNGIITFISPKINEIIGKKSKELIGKNVSEIVYKDDLDKIKLVNERRTGKRAIRRLELRLTGEKGIRQVETRYVGINATGVYESGYNGDGKIESRGEPKGKYVGTHGTITDITERKKAEEALRTAQKYSRNIIDSSLDMIISVDENRRIVEFNHSAQETFGYGRDEIIGKHIDILYADTEEGVKVYETTRKSGQFSGEILNKRKNGELFYSFLSSSIIKNESGEYLGIMGISRDITDRKRLETQFIQAQKMESVGRLSGGIAHDFNNILTVILGNVHLALISLTQEDPIIENIMEIKNSADRATNLTRQLLAFSRRQIIEPRVVILNNTILEMDKMFRRLIGENIELVTIPAENLWPVKIDPGQIEQVLTNLVVNAHDAMPKHGNLTVETANMTLDEEYTRIHAGTKPGDYVMVAVSDTGVGMDEETMSHIFEPFFTTKEHGKGTGLGLSTCYGIIKQNGGNIWVYSKKGYGTTFEIFLPREFGEITSSIKRKNNSPKGTETILVVEDEPKVRQVTSCILRDKGYTIYEAANGEEALRVAEKDISWNIHLLITDVIMPLMSGKELSEHFKIKNPDIKVLFVSGYPDNSIVQHGILEPGIAFLQKPFSPAALALKVRQVLDE